MIWLVRAHQFVELKRRQEAETALARSEEFPSAIPEVWKERGELYFQFGQTDKATADFRKAVALMGDRSLSDQPIVSDSDKLFIADLALTAFIERNPEDIRATPDAGRMVLRGTGAGRKPPPTSRWCWNSKPSGGRPGSGFTWPRRW